MQNHRILSGATILLMVVLVAAGWFLVAQPQLAAAATSNDTLGSVQSQVESSQATIARLKTEQKDVPSLKVQLEKLRTSIPAEAEASAYIDGLNALATANGVTITTIKLDDPVPYSGAAPKPAAPAPAAGTAATPSATPSPSASPTTAPVPTGFVAPTDPRITATNFIAIPVSIVLNGSWDADLAFIKGLQTGKRLFLVNGVTTGQDADDPTLTTATVGGYIYVLLDPKGDALTAADKKLATATATPTPTPTPTVSASPNPSGSSTPTPTTSPTP
jgi:Tfp pilus assembly protein PilO